MEWHKYQHIERLGTDATEGILNGRVYVFSKLDGTNCGVYIDNNGNVRVNSRNRLLSIGNDNAGSCAYVLGQEKFRKYLEKHPNHYLYGEFLVSHTIKYYEDDAWRKLYIFDVVETDEEGNTRYLSYEEYVPLLEEFGIEYIPVIKILDNPTEEEVRALQDECRFLTVDSQPGEGVTVKRYDFKNKYGHTIWAKVVRAKSKVAIKLKRPIEADGVESAIVNDLCTAEFIEKEYAKIVTENNGSWNSKMIPKLLGCIWHTFIEEECWNIVKKYKCPKIDFKILNRLVVEKVKEVKVDIFS